jgi:predicted phage terminase large subunit-like protein
MQRPTPAGGGVVKTAWFRRYTEANGQCRSIASFSRGIPPPQKNEFSDYSVCTTWGIKEKRINLLDVLRKRMGFPELKKAIRERDEIYCPAEIIIEDHSSGTAVLQALLDEGLSKVRGHKPKGTKQMRMAAQTIPIENGSVYLPQEAHWLDDYLYELSVFPNGNMTTRTTRPRRGSRRSAIRRRRRRAFMQ